MKLDGRKLIDARHRMGLSQEAVSKKTKLSKPTIINAENGRSIWPGSGKILCKFLGIDLAEAVLPLKRRGNGAA